MPPFKRETTLKSRIKIHVRSAFLKKKNHRKKCSFFLCAVKIISMSPCILVKSLNKTINRNSFCGAQKNWEFFFSVIFFKNMGRTCTFIWYFKVYVSKGKANEAGVSGALLSGWHFEILLKFLSRSCLKSELPWMQFEALESGNSMLEWCLKKKSFEFTKWWKERVSNCLSSFRVDGVRQLE